MAMIVCEICSALIDDDTQLVTYFREDVAICQECYEEILREDEEEL